MLLFYRKSPAWLGHLVLLNRTCLVKWSYKKVLFILIQLSWKLEECRIFLLHRAEKLYTYVQIQVICSEDCTKGKKTIVSDSVMHLNGGIGKLYNKITYKDVQVIPVFSTYVIPNSSEYCILALKKSN